MQEANATENKPCNELKRMAFNRTTSLVADKFVDDLLAIGPLGYMVSGGALIVSALLATQLVRSFVTNVVPVVLQFGLFIAVFEFFGVIPPL